MKTTILVITIICIVAIIGLILTNSNQDKNGQTEPITLDSSTKQRSNSKQAENLSTPPKNISPTLSDKDKTLLNTPAETENLQLQYELKNKPSSEGIKPFVGNNNDNDPVNELEQAFYQNDQQAIKTAIDIAAHCSECLPRLKEILENENLQRFGRILKHFPIHEILNDLNYKKIVKAVNLEKHVRVGVPPCQHQCREYLMQIRIVSI